ncbi:MAG TPA: T9SS type A sorting domain-containing protein [Ignavibacteria bacterium]|nr:T9SS type A sorting domain-containing protein [Ignavibacteria bacterium]
MKTTNYRFNAFFNFGIFLLFISSFIFFQGQYFGHVFNDDDPMIEQPTLESFMNSRNNNNNNNSIGTVTINDFDNFDIGIDNWEQNATINPANPMWMFFGVNGGSGQNARTTTNGGVNWNLINPAYHSSICCDPWSTYTGNGVLIYGSGVTGQYIYRSTDNGTTWSLPVLSVSGNDRNHVSAEYTGTGPYANYVYAGITPGNFGRSTDAGLTWTTTFSPSNTQPGCYIAVGPNDTVNGGCVIFVTNTGTTAARTYNFYRSTNGGSNFTLMSSQNFVGYVGSLNTAGRFVINGARTAPHPKIAMDNSNGPYRGRLYLVYATNELPGNGNRPDVFLRYSTDQGATWSAQNRINDNANPTLSDQWFPEIYCERETGKLYIHWYDDRNSPATFGTDIYATYTTDGGSTFAPNQRITNKTFIYPNPPCAANTNCYRGDYTSIAGNDLTAFSVWGDHRNGNAQNMGAFFPDFAMRVTPGNDTIHGNNDSSFLYVTIPAVKLWDKTSKFSASVAPAPTAGIISMTFLNKVTDTVLDSLTSFPDSLRLRIKTTGGVPMGNYIITVKGNGNIGIPVHLRGINVFVSNPVGIVSNEIPAEFKLLQNYPNPFNPTTNLEFGIPESGFVTLKVYDVIGNEVATLVNEKKNAGNYTVKWNAGDYPSGVYFYILKADSQTGTLNYSATKKMLLIK